MKNLLIGILLVLSCALNAQTVTTNVWYNTSTEGGGGNPEIISQGTFEASSDWNTTPAWTISDEKANYSDADYGSLYQDHGDMLETMTVSTTYVLSFDIVSTGTLRLRIQNSTGSTTYREYENFATGSYEREFTTASDESTFGLRFFASTSGDAGSIDNVSLKEQ